jgi:hypothetical protein
VTRYERAPVALKDIADDPFFLVDGLKIATFNIYERITFIPGIASKEIHFPVTFQSVRDGIRTRADAPGGVTLWSEFTVERKQGDEWQSPSPDEPAPYGKWNPGKEEEGAYELVESVTVETNTLLMPFVARSMEGAHRDICQKVIEEVCMAFRW